MYLVDRYIVAYGDRVFMLFLGFLWLNLRLITTMAPLNNSELFEDIIPFVQRKQAPIIPEDIFVGQDPKSFNIIRIRITLESTRVITGMDVPGMILQAASWVISAAAGQRDPPG